eukprot:2927168-Rhodomonas_salina.1
MYRNPPVIAQCSLSFANVRDKPVAHLGHRSLCLDKAETLPRRHERLHEILDAGMSAHYPFSAQAVHKSTP